MRHHKVSLADKFEQVGGQVFLTGIDALVRLVLDQRRRDVAAGLKTAGFVSGYRGSPLSGLDQHLWRAGALLKGHDITFQPGVNEELAATAVWGSQYTALYPGARVEGVFGLWYGKAPGVDRAADAMRHANFAGTAACGGVLAVAGDDPTCKSSTLPSQSEFAFMDAEIPVLSPSSVQEVLDFGLYGWALSRFSGLWVGLIALADAMDSAATISVDPERLKIVLPTDFAFPPGGLNIRRQDTPLQKEERLRQWRLPAVQAFMRANPLDRVTLDSPRPRIGIAAVGKAYQDLRQAMDSLGLTEALAADLGLRLYKVAMPWPLERSKALAFADGLEKILVVEHKRPLVETQFKDYLYSLPDSRRPQIIGKADAQGKPFLPATQAISVPDMARALVSILPQGAHSESLSGYLARLEAQHKVIETLRPTPVRAPFYCSGCPHNTSTRVPDGARALAGIGCHYMATMMDRATETPCQMGGEGVMWLGQKDFTDEPHVFANLGDGTYFHSGILAIRAALAAKASITFKLLYNDAVAMTGGQPVDGPISVPQITRQLAAEGVERICVLSEDPDRYPAEDAFAPGVVVAHRREFDVRQRELRNHPGVSVLIYDQTCAAEKRRRRKRGQMIDPPRRVFINEAVCEDCGDCSVQSNCLSVEPVETPFGRKRRINQSSCNKDYTCLEGFCPSFVTVEGGRIATQSLKARASEDLAETTALPEPRRQSLRPADAGPYNVILTGIGGTGVTTVSAILGMAAHMDGRASATLDITGLAQKGGAVISHLRLAEGGADIHGARVPDASADLLLGLDWIVAAEPDALGLMERTRTRAILNTHIQPTAEFVSNNALQYDRKALYEAIQASCCDLHVLDGTRAAERLMGDTLFANIMMVGFAYQHGLLPLSGAAIEAAITLNGKAVEDNLRAFRLGRRLAHAPDLLARFQDRAPAQNESLDRLVERRRRYLTDYQDAAYARRYVALVARVREAEARVTSVSTSLTRAVAVNLFKLMAYKDEYEVARLYTHGDFRRALEKQFAGDYRVKLHLAPPLLSTKDKASGRPRKRTFGPWIFPLLKGLAKLKRLRGTRFDPFGYTQERRMERQLITEYERDIERLIAQLTPEKHDLAVAIAEIPMQIRGFGPVKKRNMAAAKARARTLWHRFDAPQPAQHAA